jgi:DNA-3-methyladenine glycosylase
VGFKIGLYGYNDFFKQASGFYLCLLQGKGWSCKLSFTKHKIFIFRNATIVKKLGASFYQRSDVVEIARELLGKLVITEWDGLITAGRIVETEAYRGVSDRASHAYGARRTARTEVMYAPGGIAYVYLCYGIHHLCNVVTGGRDEPHAVLLRGIEPVEGLTIMSKRTGKGEKDKTIGAGPGNLSRALGISIAHTGHSLLGGSFYIAEDGFLLPENKIMATPRIGVDYAGVDASLPYRFIISDNPWISKKNAFSPIKND